MGHRSKTNRRRHIHAWWQPLLERAWARPGHEAAHFQYRIIHLDQRGRETDSLFARGKHRIVPARNRRVRAFWIDRQRDATARSAAKIATCLRDHSDRRGAETRPSKD